MNGSARKFLEKLDPSAIRPVKGADLSSAVLETYLRIDPEFGVSSRGQKLTDDEERRVKAVMGTDAWKRALEGSKLEIRKRA